MATAVRKVTIERGYDPRDFAMVAFGGAGPLHAADVAREIGMKRVLIPPHPGHFSAYGMLFADFRYDLTETVARPLDSMDMGEMTQQFAVLESEGARALETIGLPVSGLRYIHYAEMRYQQQEYTLKVRLPAHCDSPTTMRRLFEEAYNRRYGHASHNIGIDVVMLRLVVEGRAPRPREKIDDRSAQDAPKPVQRPIWFEQTGVSQCDVWQREALPLGFKIQGPALIEEQASTTVLGPSDLAEIDRWGNIVIALGDVS
jgi:N-methylhydantoinase A